MLDRDLAELYGVETKRLNEQVKRNAERFPSNFMFQLTKDELEDWRSQIATSNANTQLEQLAHGQDIGQVSRPLFDYRQQHTDPCWGVAELPRQKVFCLLVAGQVKHPGHFGKDLMTSRNTRKAERRPDGRRSAFRPQKMLCDTYSVNVA